MEVSTERPNCKKSGRVWPKDTHYLFSQKSKISSLLFCKTSLANCFSFITSFFWKEKGNQLLKISKTFFQDMFSEANLGVELQDKTFDNSCCGSDSLCVCKGFKSQGLLARYGRWESDDFWFVDKSLIRRIVPSGQRARSRAVTRLQTQDSGHSPSCKTHRLQSNIDLQRPFLGRA